MHGRIRALITLLLLFFASTRAGASFHLWQMNELYSNPDGQYQFLELTAFAAGQQFLAGHTLVTATTTGTKVHVFASNLPGDTFGHRMLIGTQSFAALGSATPDYIVPDGFFPLRDATITFAEGADVWSYSSIADYCDSLARDGSFAMATPTNFAGQTGADPCMTLTPIPLQPTPPPAPPAPPPALNVQALWWRWPAGSENGWGLNITQQGEKLFATWFTYDANGSPTWMVMDDARKVGTNSYFGTVYRTRGAPFGAYDRSRFSATAAGVATLAFTDPDNGTFTYTVDGITERKPIIRFVFANPVPTCEPGPGPGGNTTSYQDLWWVPAGAESGWGVNIAHQGGVLFATWFTYGADGSPVWFLVDDARRTGPSTYAGSVYQPRGAPFTNYDPSRYSATAVGTATFTFADFDNGTFSYTVNGVSQSKAITRYVFASPRTTCHF